MSTLPEAEKTLEAIYLYIADYDARHPLNPELKQIRVRAITEEGREEAEFFGSRVEVVHDQVRTHAFNRKPGTFRLLWVESPGDHPVLSKLLHNERDVAEMVQADAEKTSGRRPMYEPADLKLMRSEYHICYGCQIAEICAIASHPAFDANLITITGCAQFRPHTTDEKDTKDGVHRPE